MRLVRALEAVTAHREVLDGGVQPAQTRMLRGKGRVGVVPECGGGLEGLQVGHGIGGAGCVAVQYVQRAVAQRIGAASHRLALARAERQVCLVDAPAAVELLCLEPALADQILHLAAGLAEELGGLRQGEQHG